MPDPYVTHLCLHWEDLPYLRMLLTSLALFAETPHEIVIVDGNSTIFDCERWWKEEAEPRYRTMNGAYCGSTYVKSPREFDAYRNYNFGLPHARGQILYIWGVDEVAGHPGFDGPINHYVRDKWIMTPSVYSAAGSSPEPHRRWFRLVIGSSWENFDPAVWFAEVKRKWGEGEHGRVDNETNYVPLCVETDFWRSNGGYWIKDDLRYPESLDVFTLCDRFRPIGGQVGVVRDSYVFHFVGCNSLVAAMIAGGRGPEMVDRSHGLDERMIEAARVAWPDQAPRWPLPATA